MSLPWKGSRSSLSRGTCWDLVSCPFRNYEFNRCGGIGQNWNIYLPLLMWRSEHMSNENPRGVKIHSYSQTVQYVHHGPWGFIVYRTNDYKWTLSFKLEIIMIKRNYSASIRFMFTWYISLTSLTWSDILLKRLLFLAWQMILLVSSSYKKWLSLWQSCINGFSHWVGLAPGFL